VLLLVQAPSTGGARAQPPPPTSGEPPARSATAETLFDEGRQLVREGRYEEGCAKLAESQRLEPAMGTQFNLADCFEKLGRLASAWSLYRDVEAEAARVGETDKALAAERRAAALAPSLQRLRVVVREPAPEIVVTRNDEPVPRAQWGSALPFDPGRYRIAATAPGRRPWSREIELGTPAQLVEIEVPPLALAAPPPPTGSDAPGAGLHPQHFAALGLGALAVVGLTVGSVAGAVALGKASDSEEHCPLPDRCTQEGLDLVDEARSAATVSTLSFVVAGAALAGGAVLWLTAPSDVPGGAGRLRLRTTASGAALDARW
jgi:hypothetical protein